MRQIAILLGVAVLFLSGCATKKFSGIEPVYPGVSNPQNRLVSVDSLQPTFKWKASAEPGVSYDFAIFEAVEATTFSVWTMGGEWIKGKQLYYREGLATTEHAIEEPLRPEAVYYWSVRERKGDAVTEWSTYDYQASAFQNSGLSFSNLSFLFRTPKE